MSRSRRRSPSLLALLALACSGSRSSPPRVKADPPTPAREAHVLDDFESLQPWRLETSDGVEARVRATQGVSGSALGLDFDFHGHAGYASARRALAIELPENYELSFDLRGEAPANDFQVKLVDATGDNVWWFRRPDFVFTKDWQRVTVKRRQIEFAWGPNRTRRLERAAHIEFVIAAGSGGGRGWFALDHLTIRETPIPPPIPPLPRAWASSSIAGAAPPLAVDGRRETAWQSAGVGEQFFALDLGYAREFGGLWLRWRDGARARTYDVEVSDDAEHWRVVRRVVDAEGEFDALRLPESDARYLRLALHASVANTYALEEVEVKDLAFGASPNAFVTAVAKEAPRGTYPRGFSGEQSYWTLLGVDAGADSALISEDGAVEIGTGGFSIEPFVVKGGKLATWADVHSESALADGYLPLPSVTWSAREWRLVVSSFVSGARERPELALDYRIENLTNAPLALSVVFAVRPFQVNPPTQALNLVGGVSAIERLAWDGATLAVNGHGAVFPLSPPDRVALARFDAHGFPGGALPPPARAPAVLEDVTGLASAALAYDVELAAGEAKALNLVAPLVRSGAPQRVHAPTRDEVDEARQRVTAEWREALNRVSLTVPAAAQPLADTLRSTLAQILMSRDGAMLRPGTRSYARSWIRDGAMMSEALLRLGHASVARDYLRFYAPYQFESGKVPCCVDARGADPVPENDSSGEFIFLAAEVYRYSNDAAELERVWPAIERAAAYLEALRQSERGEKNTTPERRAFYGLMPPSISHEGYSDKAAYSYWDDFWALIGFEDAAEMARVLGKDAAAERLARQRDEFRADLAASLRASMAAHSISFLPGAADRGDFDATSTTIALSPGRALSWLPKDALYATFERYFANFEARRSGAVDWDVYTPYELRTIATFVRLGWRERSWQLLDFFMQGRRPPSWNQWAEVVGRDAREPRFIGDMPHAWIASDYIRSLLDLFAFARDGDHTLVLAAGIPAAWWASGGVVLRDLRTANGTLSYSIARRGSRAVMTITGTVGSGGCVVPWPWSGQPTTATVNGQRALWQNGELRVHRLPAEVALQIPEAARADPHAGR